MISFPEPKMVCPLCYRPLPPQTVDAFADDIEVVRIYACPECGWEGVARFTISAEIQEDRNEKHASRGDSRKKGRSITGKRYK